MTQDLLHLFLIASDGLAWVSSPVLLLHTRMQPNVDNHSTNRWSSSVGAVMVGCLSTFCSSLEHKVQLHVMFIRFRDLSFPVLTICAPQSSDCAEPLIDEHSCLDHTPQTVHTATRSLERFRPPTFEQVEVHKKTHNTDKGRCNTACTTRKKVQNLVVLSSILGTVLHSDTCVRWREV